MGFAWGGYTDARLVAQSLNYIGITTVRDDLTKLPQAAPVLGALADAGIKFDFLVNSSLPASGSAGLANFVESLAAFRKAHPDSIAAVEGLNEVNLQSFSYNGSSTLGAAAAFQKALYAAIKSNGALKDIPVYNLSLGHTNTNEYKALGDLSASSDFANAHAYANTTLSIDKAMDVSLRLARMPDRNGGTVITETGYTTLPHATDLGVTERAQAKLILNTVVTAFSNGVAKTYLYELLDRGNDPSNTNKEAHFGLFNADGSPKLAATALHNLTSVLADNGSGSSMPSKALGYSLAGLPSSGGSMALAKSNGAYDLVVWAAPKIWNDATDSEVVNATTPVKVHLDSLAKTVSVYDPMKGTTPIATYSNVRDITLPVSDHPLVMEIGGTGLMPSGPAPTTAATVSGTAAWVVSHIDMLKESSTLKTIKLTDTKVLEVATVATMKTMMASDQAVLSKIVGGYQFSVTQATADWSKTQVYNSNGSLFSTTQAGIKNGRVFTEQTTFSDGTVEVANFTNGVKVNENVRHADGSKEFFAFNLKGQGYTTEHSVYDKNGALTRFERLHADDSLSFTEVRENGVKTSSWYDAKGVIMKKVAQGSDGDVATTNYNGGVKSAVYAVFADGSKKTDLFDAKGVLTKSAEQAKNGHTETSLYDAGKLSRLFVTNADGTQENTAFNIKNQTYVKEVQEVNKAGAVVEVTRSHADGSLDYHWELSANGTRTTSTFSAKGDKVTDVVSYGNGASDVFKFVVPNQPGATQHESYNASKVLTLLEVTLADGTHQIAAKAPGMTVIGGKGNDLINLYGSDKFVFSGGNDKISNFHANEAASNHDLIQISKSLAASFASLHVTQAGSDALVTIDSHDSILLKGVDHHSVTAGDFIFV